jgi:hypothetical protein
VIDKPVGKAVQFSDLSCSEVHRSICPRINQ